MQLGVNYLLEVKDLFEEGKIDFIDYMKLYSLNEDLSALDWCLSKRWLMFHGAIGKASAFGDRNLINFTDVEKTKDILEKSKTPYFSAHICTRNEDQTEEETLQAIKQNVIDFKNAFHMDIALENIPFRKHYRHCEYLLRPEVISQIVYENDIYFLFDISHARQSANHFNMTLEEYVSKLPMDRVVEFHLAGMYDLPDISKEEIRSKFSERQIRFIKAAEVNFGKRFDYHGKLTEEDYKFLEEYLPKYKSTLKYVTLEYGSYNDKTLFEDEAFTYPIANFEESKPEIKEEVLTQLKRLKLIVDKINE